MRVIKFLACLLVLCWSANSFAGEKIKVACLGDSITFGMGAKPRETMSYPAQLQTLLGDAYEVKNCGKSGIKMIHYLRVWEAKIAEFQPDIVTIKLGTNDTKGRKFEVPGNKEAFTKAFTDAATQLITFLQGLESKPKIYVCLPVPVFKDKYKIQGKSLDEDIIPALKAFAKEKNLPVIDCYTLCKDMGSDVSDGVHPNAKVYTVLAEKIAKAITPEK